jgi:hypothetical protein
LAPAGGGPPPGSTSGGGGGGGGGRACGAGLGAGAAAGRGVAGERRPRLSCCSGRWTLIPGREELERVFVPLPGIHSPSLGVLNLTLVDAPLPQRDT